VMRALGVRADLALTAEQTLRLAILADFDLESIRDRLTREARVPPEWIDAAILEFRRYVGLRVLGHAELGMYSAAVDEVWHTTLLHTALYADMCDQVLGRFLHHRPADGHEAAGAEAYRAGFVRFRQAYEDAYGPLAGIWRVAWKSV
jgi:hypothetical protein